MAAPASGSTWMLPSGGEAVEKLGVGETDLDGEMIVLQVQRFLFRTKNERKSERKIYVRFYVRFVYNNSRKVR